MYLQKRQQIIDELRLVYNIIMEYQKLINLLDIVSNQRSSFKAKYWVEINDESKGKYDANSDIKFKTIMLKSSLCDYRDAYILVKRTITVPNTTPADANANNVCKRLIFKNCAPFTNFISERNNTQVDNAKDIDVVIPVYNLIEYGDNHSKSSGSLWQYCKDIPAVDNNCERLLNLIRPMLLIRLILRTK